MSVPGVTTDPAATSAPDSIIEPLYIDAPLPTTALS